MKIAICVRGSVRSWDVCKHNIFQTFNSFPEECKLDWFFDTWDVDSFTHYDICPSDNTCKAQRIELEFTDEMAAGILTDFITAEMNLISFNAHSFDAQMNPSLSFLKLIYLSNLSKRSIELMNNFKYDVVIQIRPDTVFKPSSWINDDCAKNIMDSGKHFGLNYSNQVKKPGQKLNCFNEISVNDRFATVASDVPGIPDFAFYGPSAVIDLLSSAYIDAKKKEEETNICFPHATLFNFLQRYGVIMYDHFLDVMIVRNMRIDGKYEYEYFKNNPNEVLGFTDSFCDGISECTDIWYDLYDRFKII